MYCGNRRLMIYTIGSWEAGGFHKAVFFNLQSWSLIESPLNSVEGLSYWLLWALDRSPRKTYGVRGWWYWILGLIAQDLSGVEMTAVHYLKIETPSSPVVCDVCFPSLWFTRYWASERSLVYQPICALGTEYSKTQTTTSVTFSSYIIIKLFLPRRYFVIPDFQVFVIQKLRAW